MRRALTIVALTVPMGAWAQVPPDAAEPAPPVVRPAEPAPPVVRPAEPAPPVVRPDVDKPAPPPGPGPDVDEPALPAGLGPDVDEPALPAGLDGTDTAAPSARTSTGIPLAWRAIVDLRGGARVVRDPLERRTSLAEARVQLDLAKSWRPWSTTVQVVVDGVGDLLAEQQAPELETGAGAVDLRTAALTVSPASWLDVRAGRQILTWGTADLLFINDLFPKDWTSFLVGRHDEYLKAPSDALKLAVFTPLAGLDVVLTPRFDADRLPLRDRLSSWDPALARLAGEDDPLVVDRPDEWLRDGEIAARLHRSVGSWEVAGYGYRGFWKSPAGMDPTSGAAVFPVLSVYGASARGPGLGGLFHAELGYYDSRDDRGGRDPAIRNSEGRALVGHERQLVRNLTIGVQYYLEVMRDHTEHVETLPPGMPVAARLRHVGTMRLTVLAIRQRLALSVFVLGSPTDRDGYVRASASYALDDHWTVLAGGNFLAGRDEHTAYGQLANNSNAYAGLRVAY